MRTRPLPRRARRHAVRLVGQVVRERDFRLVARHVLDLSDDGMLVRPVRRVLTGERLLVTFMAPFTRTWIDLEATVARVVHGRRDGDRGMAYGLAFESLDPAARALLRQQLATLPPPLPIR